MLAEKGGIVLCPSCGARMRKIRGKYHFTESGLENVYLAGVDVYRCKCGEHFARIPHMPELLAAIGEAVVNKPGKLTGREIRYLRKNAGFSSKTFADYLHQTPETLSRWENGKSIGEQSDLLVRLCYAALMNYQNAKQIVEMFIHLRGKLKKDRKITIKPSPNRGYTATYA